ncbi:uncharacterized protein LOC144359848 isoform X2 [Saccoglossus kowalevskii]
MASSKTRQQPPTLVIGVIDEVSDNELSSRSPHAGWSLNNTFVLCMSILVALLLVAVTALGSVSCALYASNIALISKQHANERRFQALYDITSEVLAMEGLDDLQRRFSQEYGDESKLTENVENDRDVRDTSDNAPEIPCPSEIVVQRVKRKSRKKPKRKERRVRCVQGPPGPPGNCSCNLTSLLEEEMTSRKRIDVSNGLSSFHMIGHEHVITSNGGYFSWKREYTESYFELAHDRIESRGGHEVQYITITVPGYYFVYSQLMYADGRSLNIGHKTVVEHGNLCRSQSMSKI